MVNLPIALKVLQEALTYAVTVPTFMTFLNLWATAKGSKNTPVNVITLFTVTSFAGSIFAGVTGISNATISYDAIVHNTDYVVGHFHAMILLAIVPAAMAVLYVMIPMMSGRQWFSAKMAWVHYIGYVVGAILFDIGLETAGLNGIVRRAEIYPRYPLLVSAENLATVGAIIAQLATLVWFLNVVLTLVKGRVITAQGVGLPQLVGNIGLALSWEAAFPAVTNVGRSARISKAISGVGALAILGGILVFVSAAFLFIGKDIDYMLGTSVEWLWITLLTIGILLVAIPGLKATKSI